MRPTGQGAPDWSPRQIGTLILDSLHGDADHAVGFADALGLWLAWQAQGIYSNADHFDPVRELAKDGAPAAGASEQ